jgi:hypothetical protein
VRFGNAGVHDPKPAADRKNSTTHPEKQKSPFSVTLEALPRGRPPGAEKIDIAAEINAGRNAILAMSPEEGGLALETYSGTYAGVAAKNRD